MKVGDLVKKKSVPGMKRYPRIGIILKQVKSTRPGLFCDPELRYECLVRWMIGPDNPKENWWGGWSLEKVA